MTVFPWYPSESIVEILIAITQEHVNEIDVQTVLNSVAMQVRDPYLTYTLATIAFDWHNLNDSVIQ